MIGATASLLLLLVASAIVGQALLALAAGAGRGSEVAVSPLAPALGIAALLVVAGIAIRLPGRATTAAIALLLLTLIALAYARGRVGGVRASLPLALPVVAITVAGAALPFALAGHVGILGAGLLNDDMASHLLIADYVSDPTGQVPSFVRGGYPVGPHAIVAALSTGTGAGLVECFAGFTVALAPLLGLLGLGLLEGLPRVRRILGACLIALPYLGAAYLAQGAFKEPLQALMLIAFAVYLAGLIGMPSMGGFPPERPRGGGSPRGRGPGRYEAVRATLAPLARVLPLAVLAAASVFNYSLPGLLWTAAVGAAVVAARFLLVRPRPGLPPGGLRRLAPYALGALAVLVLATAQEWGRIAAFSDLSAINPDRFGSDLGNLRQSLSPLEALGIWPTGTFDATASSAGLPAIVFYAGAALGLLALAVGLLRARREGRWALPAALLAAVVVWALVALVGSPYVAAKALAIVSPIVAAIALRGVLGARGPLLALGVVFLLAAGVSSLLALRQSPVAPTGADSHEAQLATFRDRVAGEPVLFLGRDDFIRWELRGSGPITGVVTNFYDVEEVRPRFKKGEGGGEKFDVDAVFPSTLDRFPFVLATTGGPSSVVPARFHEVQRTRDYVLYERRGPTGKRKTLEEGTEPGKLLECTTEADRRRFRGRVRGTATIWDPPPEIRREDGWSPDATAADGAPATMRLRLPSAGRWRVALAYDSRRPLRVSAPGLGLDTTLVANLDFRGATPTFPVAEVRVDGPTTAAVTVEPERPNALARLLGAPNEAHLRQLTATSLEPGAIRRIPLRQACGHYVDWYRPGSTASGRPAPRREAAEG